MSIRSSRWRSSPTGRTMTGDLASASLAPPGARSAVERWRSALSLTALAVVVGAVAGVGAWAFRLMIAVVHDLMFEGRLDVSYDANVHTTPSPWGVAVVLVPVVGAIGVVAVVERFAPEARGHGVPEVLDAVYYHGGRIRPPVAVVKSIASALSIGSGGSVGREGPIAQIGAAFGSAVGQWRRLEADRIRVLVAAGAAAGIAATFDAPLGGVLFAVELLMITVTPSTVWLVSVSVVTAVAVSQRLLGLALAFPVLTLQRVAPISTGWRDVVVLVPLGVVTGLVSTGVITTLRLAEREFPRRLPNPYVRHVVGMATVGGAMYLTLRMHGHYAIEGVGYATIIDVLDGVAAHPWVLLLLGLGKWFSTVTTLGSGASGGVFSPALFMGAALGGAAGHLAVALGLGVDPAVVALGGMAGMVAGTTGALLTAIAMLGEMTGDFGAVVALLIVAGSASAVRSMLLPTTIYTEKLIGRRHWVPQGMQAFGVDAVRARDLVAAADREPPPVDDPDTVVVHPDAALFEIVNGLDRAPEVWVVDDDRPIGRVTAADIDAGLRRHGLLSEPARLPTPRLPRRGAGP